MSYITIKPGWLVIVDGRFGLGTNRLIASKIVLLMTNHDVSTSSEVRQEKSASNRYEHMHPNIISFGKIVSVFRAYFVSLHWL